MASSIGISLFILFATFTGTFAKLCYYTSNSGYRESISCPRYYDSYEETYCCGDDTYAYCCAYDTYSEVSSNGASVAAVVGGVITVFIVLCVIIGCVACCCVASRRNTGRVITTSRTTNPVMITSQQRQYVVPAQHQPFPTIHHQPPPAISNMSQPPPSYGDVMKNDQVFTTSSKQCTLQMPDTPYETSAPVFTSPTADSSVNYCSSPSAPTESSGCVVSDSSPSGGDF